MPKPPEATPHSDLEGVNRDARIGTPAKSQDPEPGSTLHHAEKEAKGRPKRSEPLR